MHAARVGRISCARFLLGRFPRARFRLRRSGDEASSRFMIAAIKRRKDAHTEREREREREREKKKKRRHAYHGFIRVLTLLLARCVFIPRFWRPFSPRVLGE